MEPEKPRERAEFASALFNEDLKSLLSWHKNRPPTEQKKFLKSLDCLYGAARATKARPLEETLDSGATEKPKAATEMPRSSSTPSLRPIDMFLQKQKESRGRKSAKTGDMDLWLEQQSCSSAVPSMASSWTEWSDMTATTVSTVSGPEPTTKTAYRKHTRAFAVNRRRWRAIGAHDSTQNVPNDGFPELLRFKTTSGGAYGDVQKGSQPINEKMYESLFKGDKHPFIADYLQVASPRKRDEFCQMVRCLENLRLHKNPTTSHQRDFNLKEHSKLWVPNPAKPRDNVSATAVPLGTIQEMIDFHKENTGQVVHKPPPAPKGDVLLLEGPGAAASLAANAKYLSDCSTICSEC